ncbi:hypothetical protein LNO03_10280 [Klebsiella pneumoniae subsp. pneumoniae]|nr:hypothetical protein [Klebsiella pneumoniae subsp. pneumoniae]
MVLHQHTDGVLTFSRNIQNINRLGFGVKKEGRGLSGQGGNSQVTDKPKQFVVFDSVESSMEYIVYYINKHGGNYARWYSTQDSAQKLYREECGAIKPRFTNEFSEVKS